MIIFINTMPILPQLLAVKAIAVLIINLMKVNSEFRSMLSFTTQPITLGSRTNSVIIKTTNFKSILHIIETKKEIQRNKKIFLLCFIEWDPSACYRTTHVPFTNDIEKFIFRFR